MKPTKDQDINFAFFNYLWNLYLNNKGTIRNHYKELTKRILDYNDPKQNPDAYLRLPQFEALEMYIFLKEFLDNSPVYQIFEDWHNKKGSFTKLKYELSFGEELFKTIDNETYSRLFEQLKQFQLPYSNYIFALTMGTGKTILMATCIFYEFLLSNKFPKDDRFCHNALVFAPDKTVLQSLKEIEEFDHSKVIPTEYANFIQTNTRFHYLIEAGSTLNVLDKSRFNLIVSNTQKIILKKQKTDGSTKLFSSNTNKHKPSNAYSMAQAMYEDTTIISSEDDLKSNQRFQKLLRLENIGIYLDEAHHAFGNSLKSDLVPDPKKATSLRITINELAEKLKESGTKV